MTQAGHRLDARSTILWPAVLARCSCLVVLGAFLALPAVGEAQGAGGFEPSPLRHVRVGDISVGYHTVGSGPPLVLITGYAATLYVWDPGLLMPLAEHRRVIVFDNRGVLTTSRGRGRLTIQSMADDPARRVLNDPNPTIQELLRAIFPATKQAAANAYIRRLLLWPGVQPSDFNAPPQIVREQSVAAGRPWLCRTCGAYGRLPSLRARTLVADGRRDILEPPGNSRITARRIPRARLTLYGAAGHAFLFQRRVDFAARVNSFLR